MARTNLFLAYNARIWSGDPKSDYVWFTFNIATGYIEEVGSCNPPVTDFDVTHRRDYAGRRIFPGFHESHIHLGGLGSYLTNLDLQGCKSMDALKASLKEYVNSHPEGWIIGNNWEQDVLGRYPTKADLDEVCAERPVILFRVCHHIAVVNSKALEVAGVNQDTPNPQGGEIDHYPSGHPNSGELTGIVREAVCDMLCALSKPSSSVVSHHLQVALKECMKNGVTSAHACESHAWNEFCGLADSGQLPIRIFFSAYFSSKDSGNFPRVRENHRDMLSCDRVKIFSDGALGVGTAYLSQPYKGKSHRGIPIHSQDELVSQVKEATAQGFRLEVHAIGDAAAEMVIKAMEGAGVVQEKRPILTHCQVLRRDLLPRMKALGMIANVQPQFVPTDARWIDQFLPDDLMQLVYPWKTLTDAGIVCAGGSDAPVETASPLCGIHDAIFRPSGRDDSGLASPFKPEEKLSIKEAVDLYTKNGAFATFEESRLGQIKPGFLADFVVIDAEKDACDHPEYFRKASVKEVWVGGQQRSFSDC